MVFLRIWTDEKIINSLKEIGKINIINNKLLIELSKKEIICNPSLIRQRFKTLENACNVANVKYQNKRKGYWTKERIYIVLTKLSEKYKIITKDKLFELSKKNIICHPTHIGNRVGDIKDFFKSAGIIYDIKSYKDLYGIEGKNKKINKLKNSNTKYSKQSIIQMLKDIYKYDKNIQPKNLDNYSKIKKICCNNIIRKHFGTYENLFKEANVPYKNYHWSKKRIITSLKKINKKYGPLCKFEINKKFYKMGLICKIKCIRDVVGSIEDAARLAGFEFIDPIEKGHEFNGKIGKRETEELNKIEKEKNIKLKRQHRLKINNTIYFIDGYDTEHNIAYEIDEKQHRHTIHQDYIKDKDIKESLNCEVIRIKI